MQYHWIYLKLILDYQQSIKDYNIQFGQVSILKINKENTTTIETF